MANTYSHCYNHIVFSTKNRIELITPDIEERVWAYIGVSPGHMNVGVLKGEKQWDSPMIGLSVCGILKRFNSNLTYVRFVDIEKVAYQQVPAQQAEIYSVRCP